MASSLSLISSVPDPEENPSQPCDGPKTPASDSPASNVVITGNQALIVPATTHVAPSKDDTFGVLYRNLADESQSPDSVIRATTEAARVLTAADGVAIAFRSKGVILCRARSGDLAPELGSYVNANSGISGECLRTASILVCQDARTDSRVDALVCERMGICSIVVVPLRGPVGISGILEVFSTRNNAFGEREINCLRGLAEIAEAAYERERRAQQEVVRAALRSAHRLPAFFQRSATNHNEAGASGQEFTTLHPGVDDPRPGRFLWAIGVAIIALLLITGVWLSWQGPISELAELEAAEKQNVVQAAPEPKESLPSPKPVPGIVRGQDQKASGSNIAKNPSSDQPQDSSAPLVLSAGKTLSNTANSVLPMQPPSVRINVPTDRSEFASLLASPEGLPVMAAPVSRGVTQGELIRKVDPVYPPQARADGISGPVVLEVRVGEDGTVRNLKTLSGDPQLVSAASEAVRQWRYAPTLLDGHRIETTKEITVLFKLP
jgi:TonB family protein